MSYLISSAIQFLVILLLAPGVNGIIKRIKAFTQKRKGAPIYQLYIDIWKLLKKDMVISDKVSWVFHATPYIVFGTSLTAAFFVPISSIFGNIGGDIILLISLIALGRFFMVLAGMDTASTFGGMGSSREVMISAIFEPALIVSMFTLAISSQTTGISSIMNYTDSLGWGMLNPVYLLVFLSIFIILIAETARIPVDDPSTHLELTMVHEAMLLEYSGKYLALMEYGAVIKQMFFITLLTNIFIPSGWIVNLGLGMVLTVILSIVFYVVKVMLMAVLVASVEVFSVKLRLFRVPELASLSFIAAFIGFLQMFVIGGK